MYYIDKISKEEVREMSPEEVNFSFDQLVYKDTTEKKRQKLVEFLDMMEAETSKIKIHSSKGVN